MTVRDLYKVLTLSPKLIEAQFYDEDCNEYDSLYDIEEYEVLYIKDWEVEIYESDNPFKTCLRLFIVITSPKSMVEATNTIKEIYNLIIKDERKDK